MILGAGEIHEMGFASSSSIRTGRLSSAISILRIFDLPAVNDTQEKGMTRIVVAGCTDGTAAVWDSSFVHPPSSVVVSADLDDSDWSLIARYNLFASPVESILHVQIPSSTRLSNTLFLISANSPIALISLSPTSPTITTELLFILPGTKSPVSSISTDSKGGELLVIYENGLARVCAVDGMELRRSMRVETARKVLLESGWTTW